MVEPRGKLVDVAGRKMHVRLAGSGGKVIVILPGFGVPLPSLEMGLLLGKLAKKHTTCILEFFGYGFSDGADRPHTNANYVAEIREALAKAGLKPPYVLMPYSCSGIYCEYYAAKHPDEVEALILLDSSPTIEEFAQILDDASADVAAALLDDSEPEEELELSEDEDFAAFTQHGYTREDLLEIYETIATHRCATTQAAQFAALAGNIRETMALPLPAGLPVLLLSSDLKAQLAEEELAGYLKNTQQHMARLGAAARCVVVEGSSHGDIYYHRQHLAAVCKEVDMFLSN
ncbi:MAG: alpha/beta hydrolase [Defluviitaleaceae bacterium]|nr:alpha/beta hydrolase [Defluviitaleaceae bacterium]